jgi:hypothetical protein
MGSRKRIRRLSARDARAALVQKKAERARWLRRPPPRATHVVDAVERAGTQVHAIGIGRKIVGGVATQTACVRFYVTQKLPRGLLKPETVIPMSLDGVPTDVIEAPIAYFAAPPPLACSVEEPLHGALVHKHGRSTGYSTGLIDDPWRQMKNSPRSPGGLDVSRRLRITRASVGPLEPSRSPGICH